MKRFLLVTAALALLALLFWLVLERGSARGPVGASAPTPVPPADTPRAVPEVVADSSGRTEVPGTTPLAGETKGASTAEVQRSAPEATRVRGRVLDPEGQGLAGVPIAKSGGMFGTADDVELAVSDAGGRFEIEMVLGKGTYQLRCASGSGFATVRQARVNAANAGREQVLVATPALRLAGTVVEADGPPLAGARVRCEVPLAALVGFPEPLDGTASASVDTLAGEGGLFTLADVPALAGAELSASAPGFRPSTTATPLEDRNDLWIELARREPDEPWLQGVVLLADGSPAKGARVQLDSLVTEADSEGSFGLAKEWASPDAPLVAAIAGLQPAVLPGMGAVMREEFAPPRVRLVLGRPTLSIAGRVLDAAGEPCRGWLVSLLDGTEATRGQVPVVLVEDLATRGKKVAVTSDKQGAFELEGLLARDYVVQAYERRTLLMVRSDPVVAGTRDLVLRVPADAVFARLAGVVVGRDGRPIEGAQVGVRLVTASSGGAVAYQNGTSTATDANGRFELARVPRRHASLDVDGEVVIPGVFELDAAEEDHDLRLEVARRCHFRIEVSGSSGPAEVDSFSALDAEGESLSVYAFEGGGWSASTWSALSAGGTHPLAVSEDARTLVLFHTGTEVRRLPLALVPGEIVVVQIGGDASR